MKYTILLLSLVVASCAEPPKNSLQFNQMEYRSTVVVWKVKEAEIQAQFDYGVIAKTAADLTKAKHDLDRAEMLRTKNAVAEADYDLALDNYVTAEHAWGGAKLKYQQDLYVIEEMRAILKEAKTFESE